MTKMLAVFFLIAAVSCSEKKTTAPEGARNYYLSTTGSDDNDGSKDHPWKTIGKLNAVKFHGGDTIFFNGGETFAGNLQLDSFNSGSGAQPLVITSFGNSRAIIDGKNSTALTVYSSGFVNIYNLQFAGAGRKDGNTKDGVAIRYCHDIIIDDIDIKGFQKAGLVIYECTDVKVTKVYTHENGFAGIYIEGDYQKRTTQKIYIANCKAENNPGDPTNFTNHSGNGILAGNCKNVLIEYCTATNNGWDMPRKGNGPVGIWCYEADSVTIQHCISYGNKTAKGAADGGGFDLDGGVTHSVIQYCLSYGNEGAGFGIFQYAGASNWHDNTIRYNISENDGMVSTAGAGVYIWNSSRDTAQFRRCFFYNNVIYNDKGPCISYSTESEQSQFYFLNNIFVAKDTLIIGKESTGIFLANNWWSLQNGFNIEGIKDFSTWATQKGKEKLNGILVGLNSNPQFSNPGNATLTLPSQLTAFNNYMLPANSPLRTGGLNIQQQFGIANGGKAFHQNNAPVNGIGACF